MSKINNTFKENAEDLDIVMTMYNFLEYSDNYFMKSGSLQNYYRDEINDSAIAINNDGNKINNNKTITSKSFKYKTKITRSTPNDNNTLNAEVAVSLKQLSNFWGLVDMLLINCEIELDLPWSKECLSSEISITPGVIGDNPVIQYKPLHWSNNSNK